MDIRPRLAFVIALAMAMARTGAAFALSQGPILSSLEPACTFGACEEADGSPDDVCSVGANSGEWGVVTGFGFNLPPSTTSIDGFLVEAKTMTSNGCAPVLQLHAPALVGATRTLA